MENKMKCVITGGLGFVGINLALHLKRLKHKVYIMDNMSRRGTEHNLILAKENKIPVFIKGIEDIADHINLINPDIVYHFAAQVAVTSSYISPKDDFRVNAAGTFNIVSSVHCPVIYTSTNKIYGDNVNQVPIVEKGTRYDFDGKLAGKGIPEHFSIDAETHTPYGVSKLVGDLYTREYKGVVNRCSCMYGPNQFGIVDQGWVSYFIMSKLKKRKITIYGDGKQVRDILYSEDLVRLLELQALNIKKIRAEVFNIGGGYDNTVSLLELCKLLNIKPDFDEWRPADQKVYYSDINKAKKVLNWEPTIGPKEGVNKLLKWWKDNINILKSIS